MLHCCRQAVERHYYCCFALLGCYCFELDCCCFELDCYCSVVADLPDFLRQKQQTDLDLESSCSVRE